MIRWLARLLPVAGLVFSSATGHAQTHAQDYDIVQFSYVTAGASRGMMDDLSGFLQQRRFGAFSDWAVSFGVGSQIFVQQLELANELRFVIWEDAVEGNTRASLWAGSVHFDLGIDVMPPEGLWRLYPYVSAGGALIRLHQRDDRTSFDALEQGPGYSLSMWQGTFLFGGGIGLSRIFCPGRMLYSLGVRVGYQADPVAETSWVSRGTAVNSGPHIRLSGPYAQAIIGFGRNPRYGLSNAWSGSAR